MASIDFVAIPAAANYVTFDDLRLGRSSQEIVGRLLRFWDAKNIKKDGEFMGIVLLLLDEKNSVIHGFIPAVRASQYHQQLREGLIVKLTDFEVGRCTNLYKITDHPFVIRFLPGTTISDVSDVGRSIAKEKFMLRKLDHLQALANTNLELPDVVGHIRFVQGSNLRDASSTQRLVVRFQIDSSVTVSLSLWDDTAATFRAHLSSKNKLSSVMLVTTVNPKLFGGNLFLNSTPATKFYFDPKIEAIQEFTKRSKTQTGNQDRRDKKKENIFYRRPSYQSNWDKCSCVNCKLSTLDYTKAR
ncbi:uncharacterized protein LOC18991950 [Eutrema salsugineum]|nr:uncharacterized protein LOC18991950 [Eutrema salsugineum]